MAVSSSIRVMFLGRHVFDPLLLVDFVIGYPHQSLTSTQLFHPPSENISLPKSGRLTESGRLRELSAKFQKKKRNNHLMKKKVE